MATKYTILETTHTEESEPYTRKEYAVRDADKLAEQYPGTEFAVATSSGKVVHKVKTEAPEVDEAVDPAPVDDVPEVQVDADVDADFDPEDPDNDVDADFEPESDQDIEEPVDFNTMLAEVAITAVGGDPAVLHEADGEEDPGHGLEVVSTEEAVALLAQADAADTEPGQDDGDEEDGDGEELDADDRKAVAKLAATALGTPAPAADPAPAAPAAAPAGATLELCAPNTNAKRMHYRPIGEQRTVCGSANTSRRANAHQIETASLCPNCEKLAKGQTVDDRPAGASRGTRKAPKRLVVDAGDIRDLVAHLKQGIPYPMELADGTRIEVVGGDPASKELDEPEKDNLSDIRSINIVAA